MKTIILGSLCVLLCFFALGQDKNNNGFSYLCENGEKITKVTVLDPSTMYSNYYYIDDTTSHSQKLYTGIITRWHALVETPKDSMCIINGVLDGYHKFYSDIQWGVDYPTRVVYINQEQEFEVNIDNNMTDSTRSRAFLNLFIENVYYAYNVDFKKRRIKLERVRRDDNLEKLKLEKDKFRFRCLEDLETYFKSEAEAGIIATEILEKCRKLGFFDKEPIEEPVILGNCNEK